MFLFLLLLWSSVAFGQAPSDPAQAVNVLIGGYGASETQELTKAPHAFALEQAVTAQLPQAVTQSEQDAAKSVDDFIQNYCLSPNPAGNAPNNQGATGATQMIATLPTSAYRSSDQTADDKSLSAEALFGTVQLDEKPSDTGYSQTQAENFLKSVSFAGGLTTQIVPSSQVGTVTPNTTLATHIASLYSYTSLYSIAMSNFYRLYEERKSQKSLGCKTGLASSSAGCPSGYKPLLPNSQLGADLSPLMVDQTLATYRLDPDWKKNIVANETPIQVEKEMLFVLAEIRYELFRLRMEQERVIATLSGLHIQNSVNYRNGALVNQSAAGPSNKTSAGSSIETYKQAQVRAQAAKQQPGKGGS